jgi:SAM-dependent methyltransferase
MRVLPPRTYESDARTRQRLFTLESVAHPAKMHIALVRDLFLRYTRPGQTVLDPFGGVGTSLLGAVLLEPRNVWLVELEPRFVEMARANAARLRSGLLPGMAVGEMRVEQGDSRKLPFESAADVCVTSPPYADSLTSEQDVGKVRQRLIERGLDKGNASCRVGQLLRGKGTTSAAMGYGYSPDPANIGNLPAGDVDAVLGSPPYSDVASRNRSDEPYSRQMDPEVRKRYGSGCTNRHIDGYGSSAGQIGGLPHAVISSPPYAQSQLGHHNADCPDATTRGDGRGAGTLAYAQFSPNPAQLSTQDGETYAAAVLQVYRECYRVVRPGGVLVLVTGNYVRNGAIVDLAADTMRLAEAAGWTPVERWRHEKAGVSFWRRLHHKQGRPVVTHEDVLVFCKGGQPGWAFTELPPTTRAPVHLGTVGPVGTTATQLDLLSVAMGPVK